MYGICQTRQGGRQRPAPHIPIPSAQLVSPKPLPPPSTPPRIIMTLSILPSNPPSPTHSAFHSTYGASSALSVIVGSLGTFGTGVILDQAHDWSWVYGIAAGVYVAGAALFAGMYKAQKIFD